MFFVSEEYLRSYEESGEVGGSTLGQVAPLGESLFPAKRRPSGCPSPREDRPLNDRDPQP